MIDGQHQWPTFIRRTVNCDFQTKSVTSHTMPETWQIAADTQINSQPQKLERQ
jgi:hypothetical protein